MSDFGKGHKNNSIGWGQSSDNSIGFGTHNYIHTFFTKKIIKEMIQKINRKEITVKEQVARIGKRNPPKETQPMKVRTPKAIKYLTKLKRGQTPLVKKLHNVLLAVRHQIITMQDLEKLIAEYPEVEKLTNKGKESKLNGTLLTLQFYNNGSLEFTVILSEGKLYRFKK
jgi:predicted transcriptional regulator